VQEDELAVGISISWGWRIDPGVFFAFAELAPGVKVETAERAVWEEIAKVVTKGVTAAEVRRAKALLRSAVLHELATHHGVAHALGQAEALLGDWREAGRALTQYDAIGPKDIARVAAEYLDPSRRNVVVLEPEVRR
jgi:zinc protease